jgi:chromosome segregation ATPase
MVMENERDKAGAVETAGDETDLKQENENLSRELRLREAAVVRLEQALAAKDGEIAALKQALDEANRQLSELGKALPQAVAAYKALLVQANPGVLAEMITGDTIEEVNESLKNARALVERVRQEMEAEASLTKIPAGAPQRAPLDLSALSPREKIKYAIGGSSSSRG